MNLTDFSKDISEEFGIPEYKAKKLLSFLTKKIRNRLIYGIEVTFREIGTFRLKIRPPKKYLNLQTNTMEVADKAYRLKFEPTKKMRDDLRKKPVY